MRPSKVVALTVGTVVALVSLGLLGGGALLVWAHATQRDGDGYFTASAERFETATYAITSTRLDLRTDQGEGEWNPVDDVGTVRVRAERVDGGEVFVGIARAADVERYLAATAHDELVDVRYAPFEATYRPRPGEQPPVSPVSQRFWAASAAGAGRQVASWEIDDGDWVVVVMNADASRGVDVVADAGIRTRWLLPIGAGLFAAGLFAAAVALALILVGARSGGPHGTAPAGSDGATSERDLVGAGTGSRYPLRIVGHVDEPLSRWLWLVKWFLAIPHLVVLGLLWAAMAVATVAAGLAILFTGRYPRPLFDFNVGVLRWTWRVTFYALAVGTDRYPPFSLASDPAYPADLDVAYPATLSRPLVLVKWWLLAVPHYLLLAIFGGGLTWWTWSAGGDGGAVLGGGLIGLLAVIAAVTLAVTGRYPRQLFDLVMGLERWTFRVVAYAALMTDEYPPFRLDTGGGDPNEPGPVRPDPDRDPTLAAGVR